MNNSTSSTPARVIVARGTIDIAAALEQAAALAGAGRCVIVAGLVFRASYPTRQEQRWQFSLSHNGQPPVLVSEHQYLRDAENQARRVFAATARHDLCDGATFAAFVEALAAFGDGGAAGS